MSPYLKRCPFGATEAALTVLFSVCFFVKKKKKRGGGGGGRARGYFDVAVPKHLSAYTGQ